MKNILIRKCNSQTLVCQTSHRDGTNACVPTCSGCRLSYTVFYRHKDNTNNDHKTAPKKKNKAKQNTNLELYVINFISSKTHALLRLVVLYMSDSTYSCLHTWHFILFFCLILLTLDNGTDSSPPA